MKITWYMLLVIFLLIIGIFTFITNNEVSNLTQIVSNNNSKSLSFNPIPNISISKAGLFGSDYTRYFNYNYKAITVSSWDTTFTNEWEMVSFWSDTLDCKVKIGAPDTDNWSDRPWIYLTAGMVLTLGPKPNLSKIEVCSIGGNCGFYFAGYRNSAQTF